MVGEDEEKASRGGACRPGEELVASEVLTDIRVEIHKVFESSAG
jgi:hypothetical protein